VVRLVATTAGGRDLAVAHLELWGVFRGKNMYKVFSANIQLTRRALICKIHGTGWRLIQNTRSQSNGLCLSFQVSIVSWFALDWRSYFKVNNANCEGRTNLHGIFLLERDNLRGI
jgi:hypothetical protein